MGLPAPDVVIHLHLSPAEAALRGGFGAERYEKVSPAIHPGLKKRSHHAVFLLRFVARRAGML